MNVFHVGALTYVIHEIDATRSAANIAVLHSIIDAGALSPVHQQASKAIDAAETFFLKWPLGDCLADVRSAKHQLTMPYVGPSAIGVIFGRLEEDIMGAATKRTFLRVHEDKSAYVDNERLFGDAVYESFDSARDDIKESGNCLAAECNTAAVFHLMRVAEHGLRKVAKKLAVKLVHKGAHQPIEYGDWNDVITGIRNRITAARTMSRGSKKEKTLQFYSDVADQCEYMKDIWRNTISHTRRHYNKSEALGVMQRVEAFMVRIALELPAVK